MTNSPIPGDVVAGTGQNIGLRGLSAQLKRMIQHTQFVMDGFVRVHDPLYLIDKLDAAADLIEALQRELAARDDTISLLESNARVQATLLADTGRELEEGRDITAEAVALTKRSADITAQLTKNLEAAETQASSARQLALEALSISIYRVEDENDIVLSVFGQIVAEWDQNSPEAVSILKLAAAIRDIKGAGSGAEVKL